MSQWFGQERRIGNKSGKLGEKITRPIFVIIESIFRTPLPVRMAISLSIQMIIGGTEDTLNILKYRKHFPNLRAHTMWLFTYPQRIAMEARKTPSIFCFQCSLFQFLLSNLSSISAFGYNLINGCRSIFRKSSWFCNEIEYRNRDARLKRDLLLSGRTRWQTAHLVSSLPRYSIANVLNYLYYSKLFLFPRLR